MAYYKISHVDGRITNPEQRIASDVPKFCSELSELVQEDLIAVADGLLYTWRLCSYASPKYVFWILVSLRPSPSLVFHLFLFGLISFFVLLTCFIVCVQSAVYMDCLLR